MPALQYDNSSPGAMAYLALAGEIITKMNNAISEKNHGDAQ
jgi:cellulose biosynthesis protein BcsQ